MVSVLTSSLLKDVVKLSEVHSVKMTMKLF